MYLFYGREINYRQDNEQPSVPVVYTLPLAPQESGNTSWSQGGDWEYLTKSVWGNIHQIPFKNSRPNAIIDMIFLEKNYKNELSITFKVNRDYFPQLCEYLASKGYDRPVGSDSVVSFFRLKVKRPEAQDRFTSFLADASLADPDLLLVNDRIMSVIKDDLSKAYVAIEKEPLRLEDIPNDFKHLSCSLDFEIKELDGNSDEDKRKYPSFKRK